MFKTDYQKRKLIFKFDAGTSRGVLKEHDVWYMRISSTAIPEVYGYGECAPLKSLSIDDIPEFEEQLKKHLIKIEKYAEPNSQEAVFQMVQEIIPVQFPSIRMGFETALLDWLNGGQRKIFENNFVTGRQRIPINGLIWMGDKISMVKQIREKIKSGFNCIKIKIGAMDFREECELLDFVRTQYSDKKLEIRLDANGAFSTDTAKEKLEVLTHFNIHSIEQPIRAGQADIMAELCASSTIPIALDEELISITEPDEKRNLLEKIKPAYIILKPTLLGGFKSTQEWIDLAESLGIGWWITSALESNVGLNAICQFTANFNNKLPQGLGTGSLYHNNIGSPLTVNKGSISYDKEKTWDEISF